MLAARITDLHVCPAFGGPIVLGMFTVLTCGLPQARVTDACACAAAPDPIIRGSMTVLVGGLPAARLLDNTTTTGVITAPGAPTVLIGGAQSRAHTNYASPPAHSL